MIGDPPLPSHLERFLREQVATGRYDSEGDVIRTALQLLQQASATPADRTTAVAPGRGERPAVVERWQSPAEWRADPRARTEPPIPERRSPRGLLADLPSDLGFDDFRQARDEVWAGMHRDGAG